MKSFDELTFTDDFMFYAVMTQNEDICRKVVELCIGRKVRSLRYRDSQKAMKLVPEARGIRLDVYLEDDENTLYDIEMQTVRQPDIGRRIRYYDGIMSMNSLGAGQRFSELPNSYIVFICLFDLFGEGRVFYEFRRREKNNPELLLDDGAVDILINADGNTDGCTEEMKEFLSVLKGFDSGTGFDRRIADAVQKIKDHEEWRTGYMLFEIRMQESRKEGFDEGRLDLMNELLEKMILSGKCNEEISELLSVTDEQITAERERLGAKA